MTRPADYADWAGHEARIGLVEKLNGRKQFTGNLLGCDGKDVLLEVPGLGETRLPFAQVQSAKLVMTDRLIAATAPLSAEGADEVYEEAGSDPQQDRQAEED